MIAIFPTLLDMIANNGVCKGDGLKQSVHYLSCISDERTMKQNQRTNIYGREKYIFLLSADVTKLIHSPLFNNASIII